MAIRHNAGFRAEHLLIFLSSELRAWIAASTRSAKRPSFCRKKFKMLTATSSFFRAF
jgi:hypothetical protein